VRRDAGAGWKSITASTGELRWRPAEYRPPLPGGTELPERVSCIFSYGHCDSGVEIVSHTGFFWGVSFTGAHVEERMGARDAAVPPRGLTLPAPSR